MKDELKEEISKMLPDELIIVKQFINSILDKKDNLRQTNLEYLEKHKNVKCPKNQNHRIKKNGHKNGTQRYWCYDCECSFSETNNSILDSSIINYYQFRTLLQCMYDYKTLKETAFEIKLSKTSTFELQIRIFNSLDQIYENIKLREIIQADEKYVRTNFKGFKPSQMPRPSRHDGHHDLISGTSND